MLKGLMVAPRLNRPLLLLLALTTLVAGCAKSGSNSPAKTETANCGPSMVNTLLEEIAKDEAAKAGLEATAKGAPEKANFRKLFDSEVAFATATDAKLARLTGCGASAATLTDVKSKVAKSRANMTYLAESFPDFK